MHIVMGATGHVGSAVTHHLIEQGHPVTVVTRDADNAQPLADAGAAVTTCDARDPDALRAVLRHGHHAFLLNPPADPSTDTDAEERAGVEAILAALDGSGLDRVVALSTYGAQAGDALGDLSVMHELETGLRAQPIPAAVVRGAHFMSNWDAALAQARDQGELHTFVPIDIALPMVAPRRSRPRRGPPAHRRLGTRLDSSTSATSRDPTVTRPATSRPPSRRHWPAPSKRVGSRALSGSGRSASSGSRRRRHGRTRA